jgi:hypothetical protein
MSSNTKEFIRIIKGRFSAKCGVEMDDWFALVMNEICEGFMMLDQSVNTSADRIVGAARGGRQKLLATTTVLLSRAVDPEIRSEITNTLKLSGMMSMIAKRLEYNVLVNQNFVDMSAELQKMVRQVVVCQSCSPSECDTFAIKVDEYHFRLIN